MYISDSLIERIILEDVPYIDLTTMILGIGGKPGKIEFFTREEAVLAGTELVMRIFAKLNVETTVFIPSGQMVAPETVFLEGRGTASDLHAAWKVSLNVLEYCSGIATKTAKLVRSARAVNPQISIVTTRKVFPGTKELAIRAVVAGGGIPHRLGLSETVLVFQQHLNFLGGVEGFLRILDQVRAGACEKKIVVEAQDRDTALRLCRAGVHGIQFDKVPPRQLKAIVGEVRAIDPAVTLLAAGGINLDNVEEYARTGVDAIVTTSVYFGKPVDMSARITGA